MKHKSNSLRVVSMLLILVLVVGLLPMQAFAADSRTIYFDNTANWSTVYIYYWSDSNTGMVAWPGAVMSLESGSIYSYTIPGDATKVIFNIGSNQAQTSDLSIPASDNLYTYNTGAWSKYALACDHQWGTGVVQTPATCTQAGVKVYTCSLCSKTREEAIAASHNFVGGVCSVCGVNQGQRIFFKNTANWSTVKIYYWSSSNDHMVTWPGVEDRKSVV